MNGNFSQNQPPLVRLLVLDIDGTLTNDSKQIRDPVRRSVRAAQAQGVRVALATGRLHLSALAFWKSIASCLPLISFDGALIREPDTGVVHYHRSVDAELAERFIQFMECRPQRDRMSVHFYVHDQLYVWNLNSTTIRYLTGTNIHPIAVRDLKSLTAAAERPTKIMVLLDNRRIGSEFCCRLRQCFSAEQLTISRPTETSVQLTCSSVSKGVAVKFLAEEVMGIRKQEVVAVGDDFNDGAMLQYAGIGIAMGNAPDFVKRVADHVAPTVEENGVAWAVENRVLRRHQNDMCAPPNHLIVKS